jgi:hypothetical protein
MSAYGLRQVVPDHPATRDQVLRLIVDANGVLVEVDDNGFTLCHGPGVVDLPLPLPQ